MHQPTLRVLQILELIASDSGGRVTNVHHNKMTNIFFYDGHAESVEKSTFHTNRYYPVQGTTAATTKAEAIDSSSWLEAIQ